MPHPVLIHYHIFKNAGSSVDEALREAFGDRWASFEGRDAHDVQSAAQLRAFLESHPHLRAVSSHLARPPLPWPECAPIVFLRHPLLRARSVYDFVRKDAGQPNHSVARGTDFAGYVRWALDGGEGGVVIRDYQVVHLSDASFLPGGIFAARATREHLEQAQALISGWGVFGIVEDFERSAERMRERFAPIFPEFRFTTHWANRTRDQRPDLERDVAAIREDLGSALFERLADANRLDLELYQFARGLAAKVSLEDDKKR